MNIGVRKKVFKEKIKELYEGEGGAEIMTKCHACSRALETGSNVGRRDVCIFCGADLRCCLNCTFYAPGAYNDCREPQAERVIEKNRSNFCDYFVFRNSISDKQEKEARDIIQGKLESLFRKD